MSSGPTTDHHSPWVGADLVARALRFVGAETVFTVSGNHNIAVIRALEQQGIRIVHCRHETGAVYMAEGWSRVRQVPGVCLLTAGPGHTSALTGLASAKANESPILCLSASSPLSRLGQGAFQEMDQVTVAEPLCKESYRVQAPGEIVTAVSGGWHTARSYVPGPVLLDLPSDVLTAPVQDSLPDVMYPLPSPEVLGRIPADQLSAVERKLDRATEPLVVVRPTLGRDGDGDLVDQLRAHVPVLVADSPRGLDDPLYAPLSDMIATADLLVVVGPADFTVRYGRLREGVPLIHITGAGEDYASASREATIDDLLVWGDEWVWLRALTEVLSNRSHSVVATTGRYHDSDETTEGVDGFLHPAEVCEVVRGHAHGRLMGALDGGEFGQWARAELGSRLFCEIGNGKLGAIGGAIPQAVGMSLADPTRPAVALVGDGTFGYYPAEIDTAVRTGASLLVVVGNDSRWSAEWHLMRRAYGSRSAGSTELASRSYELVAEGFGARGHSVTTLAELDKALAEFLQTEEPAVHVLNVRIRSVPIDNS